MDARAYENGGGDTGAEVAKAVNLSGPLPVVTGLPLRSDTAGLSLELLLLW